MIQVSPTFYRHYHFWPHSVLLHMVGGHGQSSWRAEGDGGLQSIKEANPVQIVEESNKSQAALPHPYITEQLRLETPLQLSSPCPSPHKPPASTFWSQVWYTICIPLSMQSNSNQGGNKGIGHVIAKSYLAEGANVSYCGRSARGDEFASFKGAKDGARAFGSKVDLIDQEAIKKWVERSAEEFGRIDIVVANGMLCSGDPTKLQLTPSQLPLTLMPTPLRTGQRPSTLKYSAW